MKTGRVSRQGSALRPSEQTPAGHRTNASPIARAFPPRLFLGVGLIATAWPTAWWGPQPISNHTFFPLWLGYILIVDAIVMFRAGTSPMARNRRRFAALFLISAPIWWIFEAANHFLGNWRYITPTDHGFLTYHVLASIAFSTVLPAVFETAELYRTTRVGAWLREWRAIRPSTAGLTLIAAGGAALFLGSLAWPAILFPAVWLGLFFFLDPINHISGRPSLAGQVAHGRWDTVLVLFAAGLTCGFFWEMWNVWSMPKWVYDVPIAGGPRLFEMPLLGYGGYFPFALELYAIFHTILAVFGAEWDDFLRFDRSVQSPPSDDH